MGTCEVEDYKIPADVSDIGLNIQRITELVFTFNKLMVLGVLFENSLCFIEFPASLCM